MVEIIKDNLPKIQEACKEHNVAILQVFGSAARGNDFTENSDVDFLVSFQPLNEAKIDSVLFNRFENFQQLHKKLEAIVKRKVDLIEENSIKNKYLRYFINKDKVVVYGSS